MGRKTRLTKKAFKNVVLPLVKDFICKWITAREEFEVRGIASEEKMTALNDSRVAVAKLRYRLQKGSLFYALRKLLVKEKQLDVYQNMQDFLGAETESEMFDKFSKMASDKIIDLLIEMSCEKMVIESDFLETNRTDEMIDRRFTHFLYIPSNLHDLPNGKLVFGEEGYELIGECEVFGHTVIIWCYVYMHHKLGINMPNITELEDILFANMSYIQQYESAVSIGHKKTQIEKRYISSANTNLPEEVMQSVYFVINPYRAGTDLGGGHAAIALCDNIRDFYNVHCGNTEDLNAYFERTFGFTLSDDRVQMALENVRETFSYCWEDSIDEV